MKMMAATSQRTSHSTPSAARLCWGMSAKLEAMNAALKPESMLMARFLVGGVADDGLGIDRHGDEDQTGQRRRAAAHHDKKITPRLQHECSPSVFEVQDEYTTGTLPALARSAHRITLRRSALRRLQPQHDAAGDARIEPDAAQQQRTQRERHQRIARPLAPLRIRSRVCFARHQAVLGGLMLRASERLPSREP